MIQYSDLCNASLRYLSAVTQFMPAREDASAKAMSFCMH